MKITLFFYKNHKAHNLMAILSVQNNCSGNIWKFLIRENKSSQPNM